VKTAVALRGGSAEATKVCVVRDKLQSSATVSAYPTHLFGKKRSVLKLHMAWSVADMIPVSTSRFDTTPRFDTAGMADIRRRGGPIDQEQHRNAC